MKTTKYFDAIRARPERAQIKDDWSLRVIECPEHEHVQKDQRVRRWARIREAGNGYLRVFLLADRETVYNAFFDRTLRP